MTRLTFPLIAFIAVAVVVALAVAPGFVFNVLFFAAVIMFGARWFLRHASGRRSGMRR